MVKKTGKPLPQIKSKCNLLKNYPNSLPSSHQDTICGHHTYCPKSETGGAAIPVPPIHTTSKQECQRNGKRNPINLTITWLYLGINLFTSLGLNFLMYKIKIVIIWTTHLIKIVRIILKATIISWGFIMCLRLNYKCFIPINSFNSHKNPIKYRWAFWETEIK